MTGWVTLSIMAAAFQTLRFMLQKQLSMGRLTAEGATFARFAYAAPFAALAAALWLIPQGGWPALWPARGALFWPYALGGGLAQILATWCVVALFQRRNFAVGITLKKTETILTALVGFVVLGDTVSAWGAAAIATGLAGVLILTDMPELKGRGLRRVLNIEAGLGVASGVFFALSAVGYRGATLEVESDVALTRALATLAVVTAAQAGGMALWLRWHAPGQVGVVAAAWRPGVWMGLTSMAGSACWFTAFTLMNAAYVFTVGQIEVIFSIAASVLWFRERMSAREALGIAVLTASILGLVLLG